LDFSSIDTFLTEILSIFLPHNTKAGVKTWKDRGYQPKPAGFCLPSVLLIDVDAAFANKKGKPFAGVGIYFENLNAGFCFPVRAKTSSEAEAVGVLLSLYISKVLKIPVDVTCDNHGVASSIGDPHYNQGKWRGSKTPLYANAFVIKARKILLETNSKVSWEGRENTKHAHNLAALTHNGRSYSVVGKNKEDFSKRLSQKTPDDKNEFNVGKGLNCHDWEVELKIKEALDKLLFILKLQYDSQLQKKPK
jgi:hypothetical protein